MRQEIPANTLLDPGVLDGPYAFYRRLQSEAPVWRVPGAHIAVVTRYALIDEASRRVEDFSSHLNGVLYRRRDGTPARFTRKKGIPQILATADPPMHAIHRRAVFPELVAKRMSAMTADIEEVADACISRLIHAGTSDFMSTLGNPLPMRVLCKLVGFEGGDIDKLLAAAFDSTAVVSGSLSLPQLLRTMFRSALVQGWLARQIRQAQSTGDTILAAIKRNLDSQTLNHTEARAILHILLAAGGESTSSLLGNAVRILAQDADLQQQLRARPDLIPAFLEEVLRLESPFRFHLRSTPRETELGGTRLPANTTVLLFWAAANRDPDVFPNPDQLDLARPRQHLTFGRGIHTCVGAPLARLEGAIVLRMLLARTRQITLAPGQAPRWVSSLQVRRHDRLPISIKT